MFLPALFSPFSAFLGNWRGYLFAFAVGASVAGWGMYRVMSWYQDSIQNEAWEFSIQRLQDQATKDRNRLAEIDKERARIDKEATEWRVRYAKLKRQEPAVQDWGSQYHPDSIRLLLQPAGIDLSRNGNPDP